MRRYGLLLHISSLPSAWGIGDLGPAAHAFVHALAEMGGKVWQFLPLNPTSTFIGNSPYSSPSAFAGNPLFISPELLLRDNYLGYSDLDASLMTIPSGGLSQDPSRVDFVAVAAHREQLLRSVYESNYMKLEHNDAFADFCRKHDYWLHEYARFVSLKEAFGGAAWFCWPEAYARRDPGALEEWDARAGSAIKREKFIQFLFFSQWAELRELCRAHDVSLLGDVPIYVTHDSADVWVNPAFFNLGSEHQPLTVSGVPPDYFCEFGQRWGNPVYKWDRLEADDFSWWKRRLGHCLGMVDMARLDHFKGFCAYWDIPAEEDTAVLGVWRPVPGKALFTSLKKHFTGLPFLAEDLGAITPDVRELMREFDLPGMHVLQFAFSGEDFAFGTNIPHMHSGKAFVYTGTHDNTTTRDWFSNIPELERNNLCAYTGREVNSDNACEAMIRLAFGSVAECVVLPVQDILNLGAEARMNIPGLAAGNWTWRLRPDQLQSQDFCWLKELARIYGRISLNGPLPEKSA